jgi:EmrB/QacA subfamily drug resistance transporter
MATEAGERTARRAVLVAAIVASSMSYIDGTAITVALPVIKTSLPATDAQAQWTVEGYLLLLSALILVGGGLGDRYGRRRLFAIGTWTFTLASIACALAHAAPFLIGARCVQGVGAALMIPESLALITAVYPAGERGGAIGMWASSSALTMAVGPLLGGWLTEHAGWPWVFWINVPLAAVVLVLCATRVPESRAREVRGHPDLLGSACVAAGLGLVVYAMMQLQSAAHPYAGWLLAAGVALLVAFIAVERIATSPVAPLRLFLIRAFSIASLYTFALYAGLGGALFYVPFELQHVMRYSPFESGAALLPTIAFVALLSPAAGRTAARIGARLPLIAGAAIVAAGFALFARLHAGAPYASTVLPPTLLVGIGLSTLVAPLTAAVMGAADPDDIGAASGINNAISRVGNLVAIAALGVVVAATGGGSLPSPGHPQGFAHAMLAAGAMAAFAACVAFFLPHHRPGEEASNAGRKASSW